jgi:hypothetical protein
LRKTQALSEGEAETVGEHFIEVLSRRSGVFICRRGICDWTHPTFREYLTACALARMHQPDSAGAWIILRRWTEDPWKEVVLFLLGIWSRQHYVHKLVQRISQSGSQKLGLLLAGTALAEGVRVTPAVYSGIVDALLNRAREMNDPFRFESHSNALDVLGKLHGNDQTATRLVALARDSGVSIFVRQYTALSLKELGWVNKLLALSGDQTVDSWVRLDCARALGQLGQMDQAAALLLQLAHHTKSD